MRFVDEYRDGKLARMYSESIKRLTKGSWAIMEVCGGQTHSIVKYGIDQLLPPGVTLIHGPGCPVCVTPIEIIDMAVEIAGMNDVIFTSFGDMLRVPGSKSDLLAVKAGGGDVRMVYSPTDSVKIALENPDKQVVFFSVGFETTAPVTATALLQADTLHLDNFSMLVSHVLVPPAIEAVLSSDTCRVNGFLAAGHVCTIMGYEEYESIAEKFRVPIVVTGFEPVDILQGIHMCVKQLEEGRHIVENQYVRSVSRNGNTAAMDLMYRVFKTSDRKWRGIGSIPQSGFELSDEFAQYDAAERFGVSDITAEESTTCISGLILRGEQKPGDCSEFGKSCTPEHPLGALMVSSEGACSAYYRYRRRELIDE